MVMSLFLLDLMDELKISEVILHQNFQVEKFPTEDISKVSDASCLDLSVVVSMVLAS